MPTRLGRILLSILAVAGVLEPGLALGRTLNDPQKIQWGYTVTGVPEAWDYTTGSRDVVVAVIDNGIFANHPDLADNMWRNTSEIAGNGLDDDQNGFIDDVNGWDFVGNDNDPTPDAQNLAPDQSDMHISHGTSVAGIIGAVGNNSRDGAGIAWSVRLMNIRAANNKGDGVNEALAQAVTYAAKNGADIINLSVNSQQDDDGLRQALRLAVDKGIAVFASAGNLAASYADIPSYPVCTDRGASKQWVIGLSAVNSERRLASFSSFGPDCIDLTAPGEDIDSAGWYNVPGYVFGWSGTSFATPFASGAAALIKSLRPDWKADDIYRALLGRVSHSCTGVSEAEYQKYYGYGLLRIDRAVRAANAGPRRGGAGGIFPKISNSALWAGDTKRVEGWILPTTTARVTAASQGFFTLGALSGVTSVASYQQFPCTKYVATAKPDGKTQQIKVYDRNWELVGSWSVTTTQSVLLAFTQTANQEVRVAVATSASRKTVTDLYSITGAKMGSWDLGATHKGVRQLVSVPDNGRLALAAVVAQAKGVQLVTAQEGKTLASVNMPSAEYRLAAGDLAGFGAGSVLVAPVGQNPSVKTYDLNGEWQLSLNLPAPTAQWDWSVGDFNDDARAEIIMYPTTSTVAARVYDFAGRLVEEPTLFSEPSSGRRWLLWP